MMPRIPRSEGGLRMRFVSNGLLAAALLVGGCMGDLDDGTDQQPSGVGTTVQGEQGLDKVSEINGATGKARPVRGNGISYHGGPVMVSTAGTNIYLIWYRSWSIGDKAIL